MATTNSKDLFQKLANALDESGITKLNQTATPEIIRDSFIEFEEKAKSILMFEIFSNSKGISSEEYNKNLDILQKALYNATEQLKKEIAKGKNSMSDEKTKKNFLLSFLSSLKNFFMRHKDAKTQFSKIIQNIYQESQKQSIKQQYLDARNKNNKSHVINLQKKVRRDLGLHNENKALEKSRIVKEKVDDHKIQSYNKTTVKENEELEKHNETIRLFNDTKEKCNDYRKSFKELNEKIESLKKDINTLEFDIDSYKEKSVDVKKNSIIKENEINTLTLSLEEIAKSIEQLEKTQIALTTKKTSEAPGTLSYLNPFSYGDSAKQAEQNRLSQLDENIKDIAEQIEAFKIHKTTDEKSLKTTKEESKQIIEHLHDIGESKSNLEDELKQKKEEKQSTILELEKQKLELSSLETLLKNKHPEYDESIKEKDELLTMKSDREKRHSEKVERSRKQNDSNQHGR